MGKVASRTRAGVKFPVDFGKSGGTKDGRIGQHAMGNALQSHNG